MKTVVAGAVTVNAVSVRPAIHTDTLLVNVMSGAGVTTTSGAEVLVSELLA